MGIAHIEDVSPREMRDALEEHWTISEKLDGSSITCGLDADGIFYSERKGGEKIYHVADWPERPWANAFRQAHVALEMFIDEMKQLGQIESGFEMSCEVINGSTPNTITYTARNVIVITHSPVKFNFERFEVNAITTVFNSSTGSEIFLSEDRDRWVICANPTNKLNPRYSFQPGHPISNGARALRYFLGKQSEITNYSNLELMELKLNKRPDDVAPADWKFEKERFTEAREKARTGYYGLIMGIKRGISREYLEGSISELGGMMLEGLVIQTDSGKLFKVVDRPAFTEMNKFTHRVKYWLVGGRRPPKPCFLSRTKDWSKERRLKRLEILRVRYIKNRHNLSLATKLNNRTVWLSYRNDLHQRTLNLFADIREGIINGR